MIRDLVVQLFIVAARDIALFPHPERHLAREALASLPGDCFGPCDTVVYIYQSWLGPASEYSR